MSEHKNKKLPPFIYGLAVIAAVIGIIIFKSAESTPVTSDTEETIVSTVTLKSAEVSEIVSSVSETEIQIASETESVSETTAETSVEAEMTAYYFRNQSTLDSHYEKHGIEMGFSSAEEYEAAASAVINSPYALYKTEKEDGDGVYYIEATNEFAVLSTDGYIRTYFLPSAGKAYFDRQ